MTDPAAPCNCGHPYKDHNLGGRCHATVLATLDKYHDYTLCACGNYVPEDGA